MQSIADALQVSADTLYEQAGVKTDEAPSAVVEAIRQDPKLSARQRQALIEIYESFTGVRGRPRRRRAAGNGGAEDRAGAAGGAEPDAGEPR